MRYTYHSGWGSPHSDAGCYEQLQLSVHKFDHSNHASERHQRVSDVPGTPTLSSWSGVVDRREYYIHVKGTDRA